MKSIALLILALGAPLQAENLFRNGDMDTAGGWKGSKKIIPQKEDGKANRVLAVDAKKRDRVSFSQEVNTKGALVVTLKFRYRTKKYSGLGLEMRGIRPHEGFTYRNMKLVADDEWHEVSWDFDQIHGSNEIRFEFVVQEGEGEVFFDDFSVEVKK